jgi:dihydrofolate reductase
MGKVIVQASTSLDGFIADTNDQVGPLFDWFDNGDVEFSGSDPSMVFHISRASADYLRTAWSNIAVDVAQAQAFAAERDVSLTAGNLTGQALCAGLVDELRIDLVPVVFGSDVRYFGNYDESTLLLEDPEIVQGDRVTHLQYRIRK